jgi:hypothetical protein
MSEPWRDKLERAFQKQEPYRGHSLLPIPLRENAARTERVSTYIELDLFRFLEEYSARGGFRSVSEVIRRLIIIGAEAEGYEFDRPEPEPKVPTCDGCS